MENRQNNNRPLSDALQITPATKNWTVLVQCLQKSKLKVSRNGVNCRNYLFCDSKGTFITVMTYDEANAKFGRILFPYKRYYISNAGVKPSKEDYKIGEYAYSWNLYPRTPANVIYDPIPPSLPCTFDLISFEDIYRHADTDTPIAIKALVVAAIYHPTDHSIKDYIVVNKEKMMMLLRLWDDTMDNEEFNVSSKFPEPTFIVAGNIKATTHHGLSLTTRTNAYFLRHPPLIDDESLLDWYLGESATLKALLEERSYLDTRKLLPPSSHRILVHLADFVANIGTRKVAWVAATMQMAPGQDKLWYSSCPECGRSYNAPIGLETICTSCVKDITTQPRSHIGVILSDETLTIDAALFSPEADRLIGFTGAEIKAADDQDTPLINQIAMKLGRKHVICFIKCYERSNRRSHEHTYPIVKVYTQYEIAEATQGNGDPPSHSPSLFPVFK